MIWASDYTSPTPADLADPWKGWTFRQFAAPALADSAPLAVVLAAGLLAAVGLRRRAPRAARKVALACALLAGTQLFWSADVWVRTILAPSPGSPLIPADRGPRAWAAVGVYAGLRAWAVWLLASAVVTGRARAGEAG